MICLILSAYRPPDHLFWHPRHQYERSRQVAVLLREIENFRRNENGGEFASWPCFFAGGGLIQ